jgi:Fic family protein
VVGRYLCAPAEDCEYLLERFCEWLNGSTFQPKEGAEIVYGIIKAIIAHVYFVWIHPFGDGNGRTARLLELKFMMEAGVPSDVAHLLSNHYNLTRSDYYRELDAASKSGGDVLPFVEYAVRGFVDQLKEQIEVIRNQQIDVTWINYVHDRFRRDKSSSGRRRRALVLALSEAEKPVPKSEIPKLTPDLAADYAKKTPKTISRDLNALIEMELILRRPEGYVARKRKIYAFLPIRKRTPPQHQLRSRPLAARIRERRQLVLF